MAGYSARPPRGDRPLAIIGISDVIVLEATPAVPVRLHRISAWGRWVRDVAIPEVAPDRIRDLGAHFEIIWASEWGHNAHTAFREALDLPEVPWPFLPVQFDKLAAIRRYAGPLPWVWIDGALADLKDPDAQDAGGTIIRVDPHRGIADIDAAALARQVRTIAATSQVTTGQ